MDSKIAIMKNKITKQMADYCKKYGFTDVIIGLSGGMDSALVLALACDALGPEHVHTLMMKTKYTSQESIDLAQQAADMNHVGSHGVLDIQPIVDVSMEKVGFVAKNPLTEQNIQSRIRGLLSMTYSNEFGYLLLSCGNKSEAAMGYCTLYGDTCGAIAPIADVYKTEVYQMGDLYNKEGRFFIPQGIIDRAPSAELAPNQKDTDSLLPYPILDAVLKHVIEGEELPADLQQYVDSVSKRYKAMEYKRQQTAPALKVRAGREHE